jgi:predicted metal-dependent phosphoesterase TrpH
VPILRGNLHAHTTFSDGRHSVDEVVARYRDLGYDFLAITDHDDRVNEDYWFRLPAGDDRLIVLSGIELDYRPLGQHVGRINGDRETLYVLNHPARYRLDVDDIVDRIRLIRAAGWPIEAMEVTDTGVYQPQHDVGAIAVPKVATDDSHRDWECGQAWIEVDALRNADAILRAVKAGDFRLGFAAEPPGAGGRGDDLLRRPG